MPFVITMRILLVSQMYPGPKAPDLGVFVKQVADALEQEGNELERVIIDRARRHALGHIGRGRGAERRQHLFIAVQQRVHVSAAAAGRKSIERTITTPRAMIMFDR